MTVEAELPDGRILEFPAGTDPSVVQATVKRVLGAPKPDADGAYSDMTPKRQVGATEAFGRGVGSTFAGQGKTLALAAAAPAMLVDAVGNFFRDKPSTAAQDFVFGNVVDPAAEAVRTYAVNPNTEQMGAGATAANIAGNLIAMAPSMIAGGAAQAGPRLAAMAPVVQNVVKGAVAAQPSFALPATVNRASDLLDAGVDGGTVAKASAANLAANTLMGALPVSKAGGLLTRAATGGGLNLASGAAARAAEGAILGDEYAKLAQDPFGGKEMGTDFGVGSLLAAMIGPRAVRARVEPIPPKPEPTVVPGATDFTPEVRPPMPNDPLAAAKAVGESLYPAPADVPDLSLVKKGAPTPVSAPDPLKAPIAPDWTLEGDKAPAPERPPTMAEQRAQDPLVDDIRKRKDAEEAFALAQRRQEQADHDLRRRGEIGPDYQGDGAAAHGGRADQGMRQVTLLDRDMPVMVEGQDAVGVRVLWQNPDGTFERATVKPGRLTTHEVPANQRAAQDFTARSSEPRPGVGEQTMADERMPRRSTDRISGDEAGGRAEPYDPNPRDGGAPEGEVVRPEPPTRRLEGPREPYTFDPNAPRLEAPDARSDASSPARTGSGEPAARGGGNDGPADRQPGAAPGDAVARPSENGDQRQPAPGQGPARADGNAGGNDRNPRVDPKAEKRAATAFVKDLSETPSRQGRGGITPKLMRDIFGARVGDVRKQFPMLANNKGHGSDDLVEWAKDKGWLSDADIERLDATKTGGAYEHVADMLRDAVAGKAPKRPDARAQEADFEARRRAYDEAEQARHDAEVERLSADDRAAYDDAMREAEAAAAEARESRSMDEWLDEVGATDKEREDAKWERESRAESQAAPNEAERARAGGEGDSTQVPEHSGPREQARPDEVRSEPEPGNEPDRGGSGARDAADGGQESAGGTPSRDYPGRAAAHRLNALPLDAAWDGLKAVLRGLVADDSTSGPLRAAIAEAVSDAFKGNWREKVAKTLGALVWSDASVIKSVAEARNSPTLNKVWRLFSDMGGTEKVHGETFEQQVTGRYNRNVNEVASLLQGLSPEQVKQVKALLENRRAISASAGGAHQAARRIAAMLDAERKWLKDAGVDIGDTKDYFPRVYLAAEIQRRAGDFKAAAERAYRMMGVENPKQAAENWYTAITLKGDGVPEVPFNDLAGGAPAKNFAKTREIPADVARKAGLDAFTDPDAMTVLDSYFRRTAKRGAFEERFGGQDKNGVNARWRKMRQALIDEGNADLVGWTEDRILAMSGQMRSNVSQPVRDAMSLARAVTVATFLRRAVISSLTEPLQIGNRTAAQGIGAVAANTLRMYAHGAERLARTLTNAGKGASEAERYRVAQLLGTILNEKLDAGVAAMKFDGDTLPNERGTSWSRAADRLSQGAMKASGLHDWTNANVADSTVIGIDFIKAMAEDTTKGRRLAHYELDRLGIPEADHAAFAKYVAEGKTIDQVVADMRAGNKQATQFVAGVDKFARQVIMKPTAADKPHLAKHPVAQMMYGLQSWMYSYWYNVQKANLNQIREAVKGEGYTPKDRATMAAAPALYTAAVLAMTGGMLTAMRDLVAGRDKDKEREEKQKKAAIGGVPVELLRTMSQAQMFGLADPFVNSMTSARYNKLPGSELGGPVFGRVQRAAMDAGGLATDKNSATTNTQERRAAESFYNLVVDPALAVTAAAAPLPLGHALTFASQRDELRRATVDGLAGQAKKRGTEDRYR